MSTDADTMQKILGLAGADAAMLRAAQQARRIAAQTGTPLAIWRDGKVVLIPATDDATGATTKTESSR